MPDLASHVAAAWLVGRLGGLRWRVSGADLALFVAGNALPDFLSRAPHLVLESRAVELWTRSLHVPASLLLTTFALAFLFEESGRQRAFGLLFGGAMLHCLLDLCQGVGPSFSYGWLFPFSGFSPQLEVFHADESVLYLPYLAAGAVFAEVIYRWTMRRRSA